MLSGIKFVSKKRPQSDQHEHDTLKLSTKYSKSSKTNLHRSRNENAIEEHLRYDKLSSGYKDFSVFTDELEHEDDDEHKHATTATAPSVDSQSNQSSTYKSIIKESSSIGLPAVASNRSAAELLRQRLRANDSMANAMSSTSLQPKYRQSMAYDEYGDGTSEVIDVGRLKLQIHLARQLNQSLSKGGDGSDVSLAALVAAEKMDHGGAEEKYRQNVLRLGDRYKGLEVGRAGDKAGQDEDEDVDMSLFRDRRSKEGSKVKTKHGVNRADEIRLVERELRDAVKRQSREERTRSECALCKGATVASPLIVSLATHSYLVLKDPRLSLGYGHCELRPREHVPALTHCSDEAAIEVERYRSCLQRLHAREGRALLMLECSHMGGADRQHVFIDALPIPADQLDEAILYLRQALQSRSQEGRLVDLTSQRGLRRAVPKGFKYVCAEWGERQSESAGKMSAIGLLLVLERENETGEDERVDAAQATFLLDVVAGLLGEDPCRIRLKGPGPEAKTAARKADEFKRDWRTVDWTQYFE